MVVGRCKSAGESGGQVCWVWGQACSSTHYYASVMLSDLTPSPSVAVSNWLGADWRIFLSES